MDNETEIIKPYKSLGQQAEEMDTYDAYKKKVEMVRNMTYEELYNIMQDCELALTVLVRGDAKGDSPGICSLVESIINLGEAYHDKKEFPKHQGNVYTEYTYEFIERSGGDQ